MKKLFRLLLAVSVLFLFAGTTAMAKKKSYTKAQVLKKCKKYKTKKSIKKYKKCLKKYKIKKKKRSTRSTRSKEKETTTTYYVKKGFYAGGNLAYVMPGDYIVNDNKLGFDSSVGFAALGGYKFGKIRAEAEYFTHSSSLTDIDATFSFSSILMSGYYRLNTKNFSPIFGAGLGSTTISDENSFTTTSFHITGGVESMISQKLSWTALLRYMKYGDIEFDDGGTGSFDPTFALMGGVKYSF